MRTLTAMALAIITALATCGETKAANRIISSDIRTLQTIAGTDWLSPPIVSLDKMASGEQPIVISFDEMSHDYRRLICHIDHCEADWTVTEGLFDTNWMEGFNDFPIDDFTKSINTTFLYTHYRITLPNDLCRLKMSGNYRVSVTDENAPEDTLLTAEFMVSEDCCNMTLEATTNTDIDVNNSHQQLSMRLDYPQLTVNDPQEQLITVVRQNFSDDNMVWDVKPDFVANNQMTWQHNRRLIFPGGNEYHKFETLDLSHPTMGIEHIAWDGKCFDAWTFIDEPRRNYLYDEDADGAFIIRNSDYSESEYTCDYAWVNYTLHSGMPLDGDVYIDGWWTTDADRSNYRMTYNPEDKAYHIRLLQKQGHYSYRYMQKRKDGKMTLAETEGNYHETENTYHVMTYYRQQGGRTWRLVAYASLVFPDASRH